jgi:ATP-dependent helicase HepA
MYLVGQRWISEAETDLGLGLVQSADFRSVTLYFPTIDDVRTYARQSAPLTRVIFKIGDKVPLQDGSAVEITDVEEIDGIAFYYSDDRTISEIQLSGHIQLNQPADRLFSGQIDNNNLYELRQLAFKQITQLRKRPFYGLLGGRTNLLPHQLYIAQQLTQDSLPRALLADEVGLGKTIEAGLILHRLLMQQRIQRVLVLVPDHLVHQWLVEMIRRFNLRFEIRHAHDFVAHDEEDVPLGFSTGQLFLCPASLAKQATAATAMMQESWDMLVVDEAHHLEWNEAEPDAAYQLVEALSLKTAGTLLLTATPEQLGVEGHFARLRLLDPERYPSLDKFLEQQRHYQPIAELAGQISDNQELSDEQAAQLEALLPDFEDFSDTSRTLEALIDRYGPGRAMYRNTRHGVTGFPKRMPHTHLLPCPDYATPTGELEFFPEADYPAWVDSDPRIDWLEDFLKSTGKDKVVLICHHAQTVLELEQILWSRFGIQVAVFHEDMDLIERDRAAAYFSDAETGARLLLCSEIGSEGRNFQFAHHLVLFDLPFNCDLIEQRIGRLDRIGQSEAINIHALAFADHTTGYWAQLLDQGMDSFSHPNVAAQALLEKHRADIEQHLTAGEQQAEIISTLTQERQALEAELEQGRDKLLELHSCHPSKATQMAQELTITHIEDEAELNDFIDLFTDAFGIEMADLGDDCITLAPGDHMLVPDLPHLPEDGFMATTRREVALSRDDVQFLSWEHPFIDQALELITSSAMGNAAVGYVDMHDFNTGDCYAQLQFVAQCPAPKHLGIERYLPADAMHLTFTPAGDLKVNEPELTSFVLPVPKRGTARGLVEQKTAEIKPVIQKLEKLGSNQLDKIIQRAVERAEAAYGDRLQRLRAMAEQNANIPTQLIREVEQEEVDVVKAISEAQLQMDSIRLVFCG